MKKITMIGILTLNFCLAICGYHATTQHILQGLGEAKF